MTTSEILRAALAKLDGGKAWTKGAFARDAAGKRVPLTDPLAACYCVRGALEVGADPLDRRALMALASALSESWRDGYSVNDPLPTCERVVSLYNDYPYRTWPEIESLFRRAIAAAEGDQ